jgi:hypothetical protein
MSNVVHPYDRSSGNYGFSAEQEHLIMHLGKSLRWISTPAFCLGLLTLIYLAMQLITMYREARPGDFHHQLLGMPVFLLGCAILFLCVGFWTYHAGDTFRRIAGTHGTDIEHLMAALASLQRAFGTIAGVVKALVFLALLAIIVTVASSFISRGSTTSGAQPAETR